MIAQFSDESESVITGIFSSPQPLEYVAFQGEMFANDTRYKVWRDTLIPGTITGDLPDPVD